MQTWVTACHFFIDLTLTHTHTLCINIMHVYDIRAVPLSREHLPLKSRTHKHSVGLHNRWKSYSFSLAKWLSSAPLRVEQKPERQQRAIPWILSNFHKQTFNLHALELMLVQSGRSVSGCLWWIPAEAVCVLEVTAWSFLPCCFSPMFMHEGPRRAAQEVVAYNP